MSAERDTQDFSDGVSEEILNTLDRIPALRVTPRTASFCFKGKTVALDEIGPALRGARVTEGSVRPAGHEVRFTAKRLNAADSTRVWTEEFNRPMTPADVFAGQSEIAAKVSVPLPVDVVVAKEFAESATATVKLIADVAADDMILDIGPQTAAHFAELLKSSNTILWNGPVGVFEFAAFENGTKVIAQAIAESSAFSIAGGGDTLAAIAKYGIEKQVSYISTGGGAFLEVLEGKTLPAFEILTRRAAEAMPVATAVAQPSLDVEKGIGMMGSQEALCNILETVDANLTESIPDIWKALAADDVKFANRLLHGVKGYAPIFCSDALIEHVTQVEGVSKTSTAAVLTPLFAELAPRLEGLLLEIRTYIAAA